MAQTNILVVEDERLVALDIQTRLEHLGYTVPEIASSGKEAIQRAGDLRPHLVLMDIKLKGPVDGITAAETIRARFDIPIIFLTAYADDSTLQRAKISEPYGYLLKPFEEQELLTAIETAIYKHQMEQRLKQNEQWLSTLLKSMAEAVIATDEQGRIKFMNPLAETLTGWSQAEVLGRDVAQVFHILSPQNHTPAEHPVTVALRQGETLNLNGHILVARDGTEYCIQDSLAPIRDEAGNITGSVLLFRDVTEERKLQTRLQEQERLAAVGQLAAGIAHEFNNILTSIIGFAELLSYQPGDPAVAEKSTKRIMLEGRRAAHLVRQILDFSRKSMTSKQTLDLVPFLSRVVDALGRAAPPGNPISLAVTPAAGPCLVHADPEQLQQALANLVTNAREAMPAGGPVQISLSAFVLEPGQTPPTPDIRPGRWITVAVSDTGRGIPPEQIPHIFEPFYTTKEVGQGTGLGLAQVYGIVKQHQGDITVTSHPGKGTTFTLYLPALSAVPPAAAALQTELPAGHGEPVLLVEAPLVREVVQAMLEHLGYRVIAAPDGRHALELYRRHRQEIALVLLEMTTPEFGGQALARTLKKENPAVKVVALVEQPPEVSPEAMLNDGIVGWLQKPISIERLARLVDRSIQS